MVRAMVVVVLEAFVRIAVVGVTIIHPVGGHLLIRGLFVSFVNFSPPELLCFVELLLFYMPALARGVNHLVGMRVNFSKGCKCVGQHCCHYQKGTHD